jgi:hypothetical protein
MEAICIFETSVNFQRTTWRYIPEDITLHNHRCDDLKSYVISICLHKKYCRTWHTCHKIYIYICMFILMNLNTYVITFHVADIPSFRLRSPVMAYCMCTYFIKVYSVYNILHIKVLPTIFQNDDFLSVVVSWFFLIGSLTCTLCPILIWVDIRRFVMHMKRWLQFQVPNNCTITFIINWDRLSEIK